MHLMQTNNYENLRILDMKESLLLPPYSVKAHIFSLSSFVATDDEVMPCLCMSVFVLHTPLNYFLSNQWILM